MTDRIQKTIDEISHGANALQCQTATAWSIRIDRSLSPAEQDAEITALARAIAKHCESAYAPRPRADR